MRSGENAGVMPRGWPTLPRSADKAQLWAPVSTGGPAFLLGQNFYAVMSLQPRRSATRLHRAYLGDRIRGGGPVHATIPRRRTHAHFSRNPGNPAPPDRASATTPAVRTAGLARDTMRAAQAFQNKVGMTPADGYPGLALLARLRQGA